MESKRNYGIDLLRLVFMFMVCILHVLNKGGVLAACTEGTAVYRAYCLIEVFAYCAVDGFAFISGYAATNKPQRYEKIVNMWFQAWFYSFVVSLVLGLAGMDVQWKFKSMLDCCMPLSNSIFWYFSAYFALFFAMPVLNAFLFKTDEKTARKTLLIMFVLFSVIGMKKDTFRSSNGYSAVWLMVLYCMGVLARRIKLFERRKTNSLVGLWLLCNLIGWGVYVFGEDKRLISYISPTVLISGIVLVVLFSRIPLKGTLIRRISPLAFGVYLLQLNLVVWNKIIMGSTAFIASEPLMIGVVYVFASAALIFVCGLAVEFVRSKLADLFKVDILSQRIVKTLDTAMTKMFVLLK